MSISVLLVISLLLNSVQFSYILKCERVIENYTKALEEFIKHIGLEDANIIIKRAFDVQEENDE